MPLRPHRLAFVSAWGVGLPAPAGWRRCVDLHFWVALAAALPVLAVLAAAGAPMRVPGGWPAWLSLVLVQPLAEEFVFRGVVQGELRQWTRERTAGPVTQANLWTTLAFSAAHFAVQPPAWALAVAVPSLVFGHLRDRSGSIWPAALLHALYNLGFGVVAVIVRGTG